MSRNRLVPIRYETIVDVIGLLDKVDDPYAEKAARLLDRDFHGTIMLPPLNDKYKVVPRD